MTQTNATITQDMLDATGDIIEQAVTQSDMQGIVFLQVAGGMWTIYNPTYRQALRTRYATVTVARNVAIQRFMDKRVR